LTQTSRYASLLAKIGAERSNLLNEPKLRALSETKNLDELIAQLNETSYSALSKIPTPINSRKIEYSLKETLIEIYAKIIKASPKTTRQFLQTRLIAEEFENLKTLIKLTAAGLLTGEKLSKTHLTVQTHLKNRATFEKAATAEDLNSLVKALSSLNYAQTLKQALKRYEETKSTQIFDILLDKTYFEQFWETYQNLPKQEQNHALTYASLKHDSFTLLTLMRGKTMGYDPNWLRLVVPKNNFKINAETIEALLAAENNNAALKIAQQTPFRNNFPAASTPEETLANSEKAFKKALLNHAHETRITELFNVGAPLAFITEKDAEATNLTIISLGIEHKKTPQDIQQQFLLPD
jgi:vacuolar-type H+-ATPase subunit C/Vma6